MPSVFTDIINRRLKAKIFYETDEVIVIADHRPKDPVHLLIISKEEHRNFYEAPAEIIATMNQTARLLAEKLKITNHFRLLTNNGYCQEIDHLHYHFLSNRGAENLQYVEE